jgi:hypothetical protein
MVANLSLGRPGAVEIEGRFRRWVPLGWPRGLPLSLP